MSAGRLRRRLRSTSAVAVVAVVVASLVAGGPPGSEPAAGASTGACADHDGVTVVVDFQELGGGVEVRCATGAVADGFDALRRAGLSYTTTIRFPGFLCRIEGRPAGDPCVDTPPATAYWSYWLAERGGEWCYASLGAGARRPPPGTVEAWSFSLHRSGAAVAAPRIPVPSRLPGATARLPDRDCDRRPTPTTSAPAAGPNPAAPPPPTNPSAAAPGTPSEGPATATRRSAPGAGPGPAGSITSAAEGPADPTPDGDAEVAGATMDDVSATTSTTPVGALDEPATPEDPGNPAGAGTSEHRAAPGGGPSGTATGGPADARATVAAVALMVLLGGGAVAISRRRRLDTT